MNDATEAQPKILIVGAGPVGLTAAIELVRRGFTPRIVDQADGPAGESRALGIHARTLEIFEPSGVTTRLLEHGNRVFRSVFFDEHGEFMQLDFSLTRQKYNFVLVLPQSQTERILLEHLHSHRLNVEWKTELLGFEMSQQSVFCRLKKSTDHRDGAEPVEVQAYDLIIGCDGAHSTVREKLPIGFDGQSYPHDWHLADVRFSGERRTDEMRVRTRAAEVLAYFPLSPSSGRFVSSGADLMEAIGEEVQVGEVLWQSRFRISHRLVERYQCGPIFLAGDAAHIHSPLGGRGMNLGMEDAATLAWLIERNQTKRYTELRRGVAKSVLRFTDRQTRQMTSKSPWIRFARRHLGPWLLKSKTIQRFAFRQLSGANTPRPAWLPAEVARPPTERDSSSAK